MALEARSSRTDAMRPSLTLAARFLPPRPCPAVRVPVTLGHWSERGADDQGQSLDFFFFFAVVNSAFQNALSIHL